MTFSSLCAGMITANISGSQAKFQRFLSRRAWMTANVATHTMRRVPSAMPSWNRKVISELKPLSRLKLA